MGYSTKRSNRHFLQATLSRSISSVNHTTVRHEFSIPALHSLATGRWASGPHRDTDAYPTSARTHRGDAKQTNCCADGMLQHLALTSRLFKVMKHPSENQSQEVLAGLVERVTYHNVENGFWVLGAKVRVQIDRPGRQDHHHSTAIKFSPHHCALLSVPIYARVLASSACQRAAHKTATYRNLRSPIGSADAIGRRKSNLTS
jgi:hypothetical protein